MYSFSKRLKLSALVLMLLGALGIAYGFLNTPHTTAQVKELMQQHTAENHEATSTQATPNEAEATAVSEESELNHALHGLQNRPYTAVYIAMFFFFMIALGTLAFYAIQYAAQAGWSIVLFRVMEGITAYLLPGSLFILGFLILMAINGLHYFVWMNPELYNPQSEHYDEILMAKSWWLNVP
ncbi:MAG: quinol:cytochrome C oxidoreductase, partial [Flavobacteriales bacterium CG_4_9_14_0_2_um_filter_35_242]